MAIIFEEQVDSALAKETTEVIKTVNEQVMKRAKEQVAETVSAKMFANMPRLS